MELTAKETKIYAEVAKEFFFADFAAFFSTLVFL